MIIYGHPLRTPPGLRLSNWLRTWCGDVGAGALMIVLFYLAIVWLPAFVKDGRDHICTSQHSATAMVRTAR